MTYKTEIQKDSIHWKSDSDAKLFTPFYKTAGLHDKKFPARGENWQDENIEPRSERSS